MTDEMIQYDVVELPSQGIFYPDKRKTLKVGYLNATDENILAAPNLISNNQIVDEILKRKIIEKDFDITLMPEEDKQAILIFLRNTAFGTSYKVKIWDENEEAEYESEIDLGEVRMKPFDLVADEKGEYEIELPKTKAKVKVIFLAPKIEEMLRKFEKDYQGEQPCPIVTKTLETAVKEVNGNRNQLEIYQFIQKLPILDSQFIRKFIKEKRPGLDLNYSVQMPNGRLVDVSVTFGIEFFRTFYGL